MQQALSKGGKSHQGLDSAAVIAIAVLAACLAIVFLMAIAILIVYYQRVKVSSAHIKVVMLHYVTYITFRTQTTIRPLILKA